MKRERDLERRLQATRSLSHTIGAMKSLSAHHFRDTRAALTQTREYRAGIERIAEMAGASMRGGGGDAGLIVIGSDRGLCGGYNRDVALAAARQRRELGAGPTLCVGKRVGALLMRQGVKPDRRYSAPASASGITSVLLTLAQDVLTEYLRGDLASFHIVASQFEGVGLHRPRSTLLLPIEFGQRPASSYSSLERLGEVAARELLYIRMHALVLDALAAEHGARLTATQSAERWLEQRVETQTRRLTSARREASTQEVIEIVAGARARKRRE